MALTRHVAGAAARQRTSLHSSVVSRLPVSRLQYRNLTTLPYTRQHRLHVVTPLLSVNSLPSVQLRHASSWLSFWKPKQNATDATSISTANTTTKRRQVKQPTLTQTTAEQPSADNNSNFTQWYSKLRSALSSVPQHRAKLNSSLERTSASAKQQYSAAKQQYDSLSSSARQQYDSMSSSAKEQYDRQSEQARSSVGKLSELTSAATATIQQSTNKVLTTATGVLSAPQQYLAKKRRRWRYYIIAIVVVGVLWLLRPFVLLALHAIPSQSTSASTTTTTSSPLPPPQQYAYSPPAQQQQQYYQQPAQQPPKQRSWWGWG